VNTGLSIRAKIGGGGRSLKSKLC